MSSSPTAPPHDAATDSSAPSVPVVLVGLMGTGKTSLGRALAARLHLPFEDLDFAIEQRAGKTIRALFAEEGEAHFRRLEEQMVEEKICDMQQHGPRVLATGGGAFISPRSRALLKKHALTVWLQASPQAIFTRIGRDMARPRLNQDNPVESLKALLQERTPFYAQADLHFDTEGPRTQKVEALALAVQNALQKGQQA